MADTVIYLVGNQDSPKTNSWLHMTNSATKAQELADAIEGGVVREKVVRPPKRRKGGK